MKKVCLGIPVLNAVMGEVYFSHLNLAVEIGRSNSLVIPGVMDILPHSRSRNRIFELAIKHDCDLVMFLDSDMHPPQNTFTYMWETMQAHDAQMVSAHCYRRGFPFTSVWSSEINGKWYQLTSGSDSVPEEIHSTGLACNLIDLRWCKENLSEPFFYMDEKVWEDQFFCKNMKKAGGKIFAEPRVRCGHRWEGIIINDDNAGTLRKWSLGATGKFDPTEGLESITQAEPSHAGNLPMSEEAAVKG